MKRREGVEKEKLLRFLKNKTGELSTGELKRCLKVLYNFIRREKEKNKNSGVAVLKSKESGYYSGYSQSREEGLMKESINREPITDNKTGTEKVEKSAEFLSSKTDLPNKEIEYPNKEMPVNKVHIREDENVTDKNIKELYNFRVCEEKRKEVFGEAPKYSFIISN